MNNKEEETKPIGDKEERALTLMLQGRKDIDIAEELGINRVTLYRWKKRDDRFMQELEDRRTMLREQADDNLLELSESAIKAIQDALKDNDIKIRLQAAKLVLGRMKEGKAKEKEGSPVLELLREALMGMEDELGIKEPLG